MQIRVCVMSSAVASRRARRLLLAEDDADLRRLIARSLQKDGAEVVEIADGTDLRTWAELIARGSHGEFFDAIISDIQMPHTTALDVLGDVPQLLRRAPVILVTAFGTEDVCDKAYDLGAAAIVRKPVDPGDLCALVRSVVRAADEPRIL
jgi:CheY-like chemotaxis protein